MTHDVVTPSRDRTAASAGTAAGSSGRPGPGSGTTAPSPSLAPSRRRGRPWLVATGALMASVGALSVIWLVGAAGQREEVVVVRQDVAYGEALGADDLGIARISLDPGVSSVPATERDALVGSVAATTLVPGMLLSPGMVEAAGDPVAGQVLVPLPVPGDRMPAGGLRAGDRILAVEVPSAGEMPAGGAARSTPATVVRVGPVDVDGVAVVDVTVAAADGPGLSVAAATGQVALVVRPLAG